jgi:hypothetical protein
MKHGVRMLLTLFTGVLGIGLLGGCTTVGRTVEVTVRNETPEPVVLWLTKDGPPAEVGWLSPGQFAIAYPPDAEADRDLTALPAVLLASGQQVTLGPIEGRFARGANPILRVFYGQSSLNDFAAVPRRDASVATVVLPDGTSRVSVRGVQPVRARLTQP